MTSSGIGNFGKISATLDEKCRFLIDSPLLYQSYFILLIPYIPIYVLHRITKSLNLGFHTFDKTCQMTAYVQNDLDFMGKLFYVESIFTE